MNRHENKRERPDADPAHTPSSVEENLATVIQRAATQIHEAVTRDPGDFKNGLDLTK